MSVFGLAGPPIGGVAALGPLGFFAIPLTYSIGLVPALIAGVAYSVLWLASVEGRRRTALTVAIGIAAVVALSWIQGRQDLVLFMVWAASVAGLVCCLLANLVIRTVERDRSAV